ncbi:VOC family protein [Sandarakinorhabdus sp. DWP1-3-1]|uniref:VOC family protein n=1 Tax=Sandarakinorhabdus sp. DWP1-3-1 TaxID=2804627 RepID=UPI003CED1E1F
MTVKSLDHVNIQTTAVAETAQFLADVLELRPGPVVPGGDMARVTWMYDAQDRPLVHITLPGQTFAEDADRPLRADTGALHHVAFECTGHAAMLERLERLGIPARHRHIGEIGLQQVFVTEPNGVLLELNFREG